MFTGIVESACRIVRAERARGGLTLDIDLGELADGVRQGDSIAVRGCCLTVEQLEAGVATFHLMDQTLGLTTFGDFQEGRRVNCERALALGDRLGGHMVSGHLDGLGTVVSYDQDDEGQWDLVLELPPELVPLTVPKGSIAIDGVSLTIAGLEDPRVRVCLIPHTREVTTLGELAPGDRVHLEMDMVGKWIRRMVPEQLLRPEG